MLRVLSPVPDVGLLTVLYTTLNLAVRLMVSPVPSYLSPLVGTVFIYLF